MLKAYFNHNQPILTIQHHGTNAQLCWI